jgi:hypothetical protein
LEVNRYQTSGGVAALRCTIVDDIGPTPAGRALAAAGSEHLHRRIVGVDLGGPQTLLADARDDRIEQVRGLARPPGKGRAVDIDPLRGHHLGLAVRRQVVIELGDDDVRECAERRLAARNWLGRRGRLDDRLADAAGVLEGDVRATRQLIGTISSISSVSAPNWRNAPPHDGHAQVPVAGS